MEPENACSRAGRPRGFCTETALDRATDVFWRKGFDGASLSDLTEAMGINRPSLYAAYGNKEGLFRRALARYNERMTALIAEARDLPTAREFVEAVLAMAVGKAAAGGPRGCFTLQGAANHCDADDTLCPDLAAARDLMKTVLRQRFERAVADGELPAGTDAVAFAHFYATVMQGMSVQAAGGATAEALAGVARTAMRAWPTAGSTA